MAANRSSLAFSVRPSSPLFGTLAAATLVHECPVCVTAYFERHDNLVEHMRRSHGDDALLQCHRCGVLDVDEARHETHTQRCHPPPLTSRQTTRQTTARLTPFACENCAAEFDAEHRLRAHMATHEISLGGHACRLCDEVFTSKTSRDMHVQVGRRPRHMLAVGARLVAAIRVHDLLATLWHASSTARTRRHAQQEARLPVVSHSLRALERARPTRGSYTHPCTQPPADGAAHDDDAARVSVLRPCVQVP